MDGSEAEWIPLLGEPPTSPTSSDPLDVRLELLLAEFEEHKRLRHQLALLQNPSQSQANDVQASIESHRRNLEQLLALVVEHELKPRVCACIRTASEVVRDRDRGMTYLREAAEQMNKVSKDVSIAHIAGYSAGIVGSVMSVVGGGLILGGVTAVAGIPILAVGATVAALGGVTNVGASISELVLKKKEVKRANEWILQNQQYCQRLVDEFNDFEAELDHAREVFPDWDFDGLLGDVLEVDADELGTLLVEVGGTISEWRKVLEMGSEAAARLALNVATPAGAAVATGVAEGIEAGVETGATVARTAARAAAGLAVGLSAVFIVVDIALLAKTAYGLNQKEHKGTALGRCLNAAADQMQEETEVIRKLANLKEAITIAR